MTAEVWRWSACELARAVHAGEIRSREAVESCFTRVQEINPQINAVVDVLHDEALADAD
jgi:amidase